MVAGVAGALSAMSALYYKKNNSGILIARTSLAALGQLIQFPFICSNPPVSLIYRWLEKSVELKPEVISYLIPIYAPTPVRLELMERAGYYLVDIHQFKWNVVMEK